MLPCLRSQRVHIIPSQEFSLSLCKFALSVCRVSSLISWNSPPGFDSGQCLKWHAVILTKILESNGCQVKLRRFVRRQCFEHWLIIVGDWVWGMESIYIHSYESVPFYSSCSWPCLGKKVMFPPVSLRTWWMERLEVKVQGRLMRKKWIWRCSGHVLIQVLMLSISMTSMCYLVTVLCGSVHGEQFLLMLVCAYVQSRHVLVCYILKTEHVSHWGHDLTRACAGPRILSMLQAYIGRAINSLSYWNWLIY